ncbi:MAG: hypothetical protein HQL70_00865 [Magnetococcales bacterium]|nr:hypothetical protein [Magnetococcales bacterium]
MGKIIVGYFLATLFGLGAFLVLGYEGLIKSHEVDLVFWGLIGTGFLLQIGEVFLCKPVCRILAHNHLSQKWMSCCH